MQRTLTRAIPLLTLALALPSTVAHAGDFVDTRINFTVTDENMLVGPGETNPSIPGLRIDKPNFFGVLFFDNYDTRYTGYENLTHLVTYKKMTGYHWEGEAALVLRLLEFTDVSLATLDDGSYVKVTYFIDPTKERKDNISLTAFPMSSDRMRLGYSYRLSWGGSPIFFKYDPDIPTTAQVPVNPNPAPGARLQYANDKGVVWLGFKTSQLLNSNPSVNELTAIYGFLGGAMLDVVKDRFRLEVNGGYFDRGTNPLFYSSQNVNPTNPMYKDFPVWTAGVSFQASVFKGLNPQGSLDYNLYRNDPTSATRYFPKYDYKPGFNWLAQSEFTIIGTNLQDPLKTGTSVVQQALAGDVNLRAQSGHMRLKADISYRSLEFTLLNQPSLVPFQGYPDKSTIEGDLFASVGVDYQWERQSFIVGVTLGIDRPANYTPPNGSVPMPGQGLCQSTGDGGPQCTNSTIVVYGAGNYSILPAGQTAVPIYAAKVQMREDFLDFFAAILDVYTQFDQNQTHLVKQPDPTNPAGFIEKRAFVSQSAQLGFNLTLQARF